MKLITDDQMRRLTNNGAWNRAQRRLEKPASDFMPVVKLFCTWSPATWLLSEIDADYRDVAYGLCDLGFGMPELGKVRLSSLKSLSSPQGLKVEQDRYFRAVTTLGGYAAKARLDKRILA
jgi:hypothetical protein